MMRSLRVLLVNVGRQTRGMKLISPPVGVLFLAALARTNRKVDVRVIDQRAEKSTVDSIIERARSYDAELIGLRCLTSDARLLSELVAALRVALPQARIVIGGPHASAFGARALEHIAADAAAVGEGELTFQSIIESILEGNGTFESIPGLIRRDASGEIVTNAGQPPLVQDLDSLPFPAYDLLNLPLYWRNRNMTAIPYHKYVSLFTSRGCPYQCYYCHNIFGKKYRVHSPERILAELKYYSETFGVREFEFLDDIFNLNASRVAELSDLIVRWGGRPKISFPNALRTDILTEDSVAALAAMGTHYTALALETGSPRLQERIGKRLNIRKYLEGVEMLVRRRIFTVGFVMLGFPTETEAEMQTTIDVVRQSKLHVAVFFDVTPYPNTGLYDEVNRTQADKLEAIDYEGTDYTLNMATNVSDVPDKVFANYIGKAYRTFYCDPIRLARILRDFPRRLQLPLLLRGVVRLGTKSSVSES